MDNSKTSKQTLKGLFINTKKEICSIYESGKMSYECLVLSKEYSLDYVEVSLDQREINIEYDFFIFNYHLDKMGWLDTKFINQLPGFKITLVLEMSQNSPFDWVSPSDFDAYIVLDPTCRHYQSNVYAFPRPLELKNKESINYSPSIENPIIGTFGLSFSDKGFDEVVKAVNEEFDSATIRINIPNSSNINSKAINEFKELLETINLKRDIKVELTNNFFNKNELIDWCAQNTLNVFLYNRRVGNGLAATTDQAIASGRPLAVSTNPTFRHIHSYIIPYPYLSLKDAISTTIPLVEKIQFEWSPIQFATRFEELLSENEIRKNFNKKAENILLPLVNKKVKKNDFSSLVKRIIRNVTPPLFLKLFKNKTIISDLSTTEYSLPSNPPYFIHQVLQSFSNLQEDILIDFILNRKERGFYIDIGVMDSYFNNNTIHFHLKGWTGINIESDISHFTKLNKQRIGDKNFNLKVGLDNNSNTQKTTPLSEILNKHISTERIDFMSINTKTFSLSILESNDWDNFRPSLVLIKAGFDARNIQLFMDRQKYLYLYSNNERSLFIDKTTTDPNIVKAIKWN